MKRLVAYEVNGPIAIVRLNRPEALNAINAHLVEELAHSLQRAIDDEVSAAVLTGAGRAFCAGHDLHEVQQPDASATNRRQLERIQDITRLIRRSPHPVIAAVHGYALGAGFEFALACDLLVAGEQAQFGFPEVEVGLSVTGAVTRLLPLAIGPVRAKELILLGGRIGAGRLYELGLCTEIVPESDLLARALELATRLAALPAASLRAAKRALDLGPEVGLEAALQNEIEVALGLVGINQGRTAGAAFRERSSRQR